MLHLNLISQHLRCGLLSSCALLYHCAPPTFLCSSILNRAPSYHKLSRTLSTKVLSHDENFFRYTNGRWLWDEAKQLRERYRAFNVQELQRIAAEGVGAQSCISMKKLGEGGYNKVFRLVMDNGKVAIARIPNLNAGPAHLITASEVATMEFVRCAISLLYYPKIFPLML